ncbi:MAG: J domain-containing protein [Microthrixaceae bacterium]|nr:J domain-containing protein [Microthrixaceae bacterium]
MERDHYRVLGVDRAATGTRIREAYRDLAWRLHPDRHDAVAGDEPSPAERRVAERRIREVNEAFRVLGEPARRRAYDHARQERPPPASGGADRGPAARRKRPDGGPGPGGRREVAPRHDAPDDLVPVAGDGVHGVLFSRVVPLMMGALLLAIVVFSAFAGGGIDDSGDTGNGTSPGVAGCVLGNTLVSCDKPNDGRIVGLADGDDDCPAGSRLVSLAAEYCVES